jgi:hypothetical protein
MGSPNEMGVIVKSETLLRADGLDSTKSFYSLQVYSVSQIAAWSFRSTKPRWYVPKVKTSQPQTCLPNYKCELALSI